MGLRRQVSGPLVFVEPSEQVSAQSLLPVAALGQSPEFDQEGEPLRDGSRQRGVSWWSSTLGQRIPTTEEELGF